MAILDLTACYYTYQLTEESSWYCVLVTPFGKHRRLRLPMGMSQSPDWAQGALEEVAQDLLQHSVECFIDDVAIFTPQSVADPWTEHMTQLNEVISTRLREHCYPINPKKWLPMGSKGSRVLRPLANTRWNQTSPQEDQRHHGT